MTGKKNEAGILLPMTVIEGVTVNILPFEQYEFLMTTKEVAYGYGTTKYAIQQAFHRNGYEFIEGKHFVTALTICQHDLKLPHNAILFQNVGLFDLASLLRVSVQNYFVIGQKI